MLGEGGRGAVWRARNIALEASVAILVVRSTGDASALLDRELSLSALVQLRARLEKVSPEDQRAVLGSEAGAPHSLLIGSVVLGAVLERLGADRAFVAAGGLREGLISDDLTQRPLHAPGCVPRA